MCSMTCDLSDENGPRPWHWSDYKDCADLMDTYGDSDVMDIMGDLPKLKYENFEDLMRSGDSMLFAFLFYRDGDDPDLFYNDVLLMDYIRSAIYTVQSVNRKKLQEALKKAEMLENGLDNLIRKMYKFFNSSIKLNRILQHFTISLRSPDQEVSKKNEAVGTSQLEVLKHGKADTVSLEGPDQEVYKKNEVVATSESEVLKHREDDTISPKSSNQEVYEKNEVDGTSRSEVLKLQDNTISLKSFDEEMYKKNEEVATSQSEGLKHREDNTISSKSSDKEVYKKNEVDGTSRSEVLKLQDDTISLKSFDQEVYKKNEEVATSQSEVLKHREDDTISPKSSDKEVYKKNELDGTSRSEVLKPQDDTISLRSSDGVLYEMNKAAASSESELLRHIIEDTGGEDHIPLPFVSGSLQQFIAFLEKHHDLLTSLERYKDSVKDFLNTNWNKLADWHQLAECLNIPSLLDLTSLFFCHHRMKVGWQDPCVKSQLEVKQRSDFFKNFRSFEKCSNHFLQVDPVKRKDAISFLRQSAAYADIPGIVSLSRLTLQDVERKMECTLGDISECFATLIVA